MSKFNSTAESSVKTTNKAGGVAYKQSPKLELASLLVTSLLSGDTYYEKESDRLDRLTTLVDKLIKEDPLFAAKASYYARDKFHLRSISHITSALLMKAIVENKFPNAEDRTALKNYFTKIVMRGDDITEILSAYQSLIGDKKVSRAIPTCAKRGLGKALANLDSYALAKYRQDGKDISMIDAVRILQPKVTERSKEGIAQLVAGTLRNETTWEATQSAAKQAGTEEEREAASVEAWRQFVGKGKKVEYFALLRNLRNIFKTQDMEIIKSACDLLTDPDLIAKSKVLPFRFYTAYKTIKPELVGTGSRTVLEALNKACELSLKNVPHFDGRTGLFIDISGSMGPCYQSHMQVCPAELSALITAALYRTNDADGILFDYSAHVWNANPSDSMFTLAEELIRKCSGGTRMSAPFDYAVDHNIKYDRIIVLSDEETWGESGWGERVNKHFHNYQKKVNPEVRLYTIDLAGNGTMQFPEQNVATIAGFSEHVFDVMKKAEQDPRAMIAEIESITF